MRQASYSNNTMFFLIFWVILDIGAGVKQNILPLRNVWPNIVCQLFCFSEQSNKVCRLLFWCVLCKLKVFG